MKQAYLATIIALERMHRQFLEVVKADLEQNGVHDINNVQALILYNIGDDELTVGELTNRGYYLGSNVSYNVKKMAEAGYINQQRSTHDRRSVRVKLTDKGVALRKKMDETFIKHCEALTTQINEDELIGANASLRKLERYWLRQLGFGPRIANDPLFNTAAA